jgi:hypothetical protein
MSQQKSALIVQNTSRLKQNIAGSVENLKILQLRFGNLHLVQFLEYLVCCGCYFTLVNFVNLQLSFLDYFNGKNIFWRKKNSNSL